MLVGGWFTRRLGGYLIVRCAMWFVFESAELGNHLVHAETRRLFEYMVCDMVCF